MIEVVVLLAPQKSFSWIHLVQQKPKITTMVYRSMGAQWSFSWSVQVSQHTVSHVDQEITSVATVDFVTIQWCSTLFGKIVLPNWRAASICFCCFLLLECLKLVIHGVTNYGANPLSLGDFHLHHFSNGWTLARSVVEFAVVSRFWYYHNHGQGGFLSFSLFCGFVWMLSHGHTWCLPYVFCKNICQKCNK